MESKYNLLTRLLKNIKNVVTPDGNVAGGSGVLVVHAAVDGDDWVLDKTYQEIENAGVCVLDILEGELHRIAYVNGFGFGDTFGGVVSFDGRTYMCSSRTDYPVYHDGK